MVKINEMVQQMERERQEEFERKNIEVKKLFLKNDEVLKQ